MSYFHATTEDRIESIQRLGLGGAPGAEKAFPDCPDGVYLASDPMLALSFLLERAYAGDFSHQTPAEALAKFRVLVIDGSRITESKLAPDPNIQRQGFWLYSGIVDVTAMPVLTASDITAAKFAS